MLKALRQRAVAGEFVRFAIVGVGGAVVDMGVLTVALKLLGTGPYLGRLLSYLAAATFTWAMNRRFTFREGAQGSLLSEWSRYIVISAGGGLLNLGVYSAIVAVSRAQFGPSGWIGELTPYVGVAAGSLSGLILNFLATKRLIFSKSA